MKYVLMFLSCLLLAGCCTDAVLPPERPLAYVYPTLVPMNAIVDCVPVQLDVNAVRTVLDKSQILEELVETGLLESELEILARGLAKHGYAELDSRRCKKAKLRWVSVFTYSDKFVVCSGYDKLPPEKCRFNLQAQGGTSRQEFDFYGRKRNVICFGNDNVRMKKVRLDSKESWEVSVSIARSELE